MYVVGLIYLDFVLSYSAYNHNNIGLAINCPDFSTYRAFSLMWPSSMQIYWNKKEFLHKKRDQLPQD